MDQVPDDLKKIIINFVRHTMLLMVRWLYFYKLGPFQFEMSMKEFTGEITSG